MCYTYEQMYDSSHRPDKEAVNIICCQQSLKKDGRPYEQI